MVVVAAAAAAELVAANAVVRARTERGRAGQGRAGQGTIGRMRWGWGVKKIERCSSMHCSAVQLENWREQDHHITSHHLTG